MRTTSQQANKPTTLYKPLAALVAALALFFCAACPSESDDGDSDTGSSSESLVTANELSGTYWEGSVTVLGNDIPLTLDFESTTAVTVGVSGSLNVSCTYTVSGNSIAATGTDAFDGNDITFDVDSYDGNTLKATVASSSGGYFRLITDGTEIEFTKSGKPADDDSDDSGDDAEDSGDDAEDDNGETDAEDNDNSEDEE